MVRLSKAQTIGSVNLLLLAVIILILAVISFMRLVMPGAFGLRSAYCTALGLERIKQR
jgi:hypothetical protein